VAGAAWLLVVRGAVALHGAQLEPPEAHALLLERPTRLAPILLPQDPAPAAPAAVPAAPPPALHADRARALCGSPPPAPAPDLLRRLRSRASSAAAVLLFAPLALRPDLASRLPPWEAVSVPAAGAAVSVRPAHAAPAEWEALAAGPLRRAGAVLVCGEKDT